MTSPYTNTDLYGQQAGLDRAGERTQVGGHGTSQFNDYGVSQTGGGAGFGTSATDANSGPGLGSATDAGSGADPRTHPTHAHHHHDGRTQPVGTGVAGLGPPVGELGDAYGTGAGADRYTTTTDPMHHDHPAGAGAGHGERQPERKATLGDKIVGGAEKLAGSVVGNPGMKEKGVERQHGVKDSTRNDL
ncbi:hypothetical protein MIND_00805200 [Mycena indigotica]|uniref:Uncharacterized protein n=1 Tax=Mycena indigotica TaxID=2126181 RepID=A0A8H6W444_9AGAR|nr:uncharacterized protein MIND_00805200 [Mycena indigotica]KAF7298584.1 hypothetical protein MIND_00805200 [Mycena indigotica]